MSNTKSLRWTPTRIRKAILRPKPKDKRSRLHRALLQAARGGASFHEAIVRHIAEYATIIDDGRSLNSVESEDMVGPIMVNAARGFSHHGDWLLVPVPAWMLDDLAEVGSAGEDLEEEHDAEQVNEDGHDDWDREPSVVRPTDMSRHGLEDDEVFPTVEQHRDRYRRDGGPEGYFDPIRKVHAALERLSERRPAPVFQAGDDQ